MRFFFDLNPNIEGSIFLAGVGRSGTTWVGDVINACNDYRIMFEPFYPQKVPLCRSLRYRQYLQPNDSSPTHYAVAHAILSGKLRNGWVDRYNKKFIARSRLIKDIRANLMLKWLSINFPELRIVILMRHPCAVAVSKLKAGWGTHLDEFLQQPQLLGDYLGPFETLLHTAQTDFEKHILLWCVENYVPLRQFNHAEAYIALYENLCLEPDLEYGKLFAFLNLQLAAEHRAAFFRPSAMSSETSAVLRGGSLVDSWRKNVTDAQLETAIKILKAFGLNQIYGGDSMPLTDPNTIHFEVAAQYPISN